MNLTTNDFSYSFRKILNTNKDDKKIHYEHPGFNFKEPINAIKEEEEVERLEELFRMVKLDESKIKPNQEENELVNLGNSDEVKEVKVSAKRRKKGINLSS